MSNTELNYIFCVVLGFVLVGLFTLILCWYWSVWGDKFLALKCRLTGHDWAYAEGRAKGALTGKPSGFRGNNYLIEVKNDKQPPSKRKLTDDEKRFHDRWCGSVHVVETVEQAINLMSLRSEG